MIAILRIGLVAIAFLSLTLALLPVQLLALGFGHPVMRRLPRWWHRIMCKVIGLKVKTIGTLTADRPLLVAANHTSWKDIVVLGSVADVVFVAKSEVRRWPVFGWLARLQRSVFIERAQKRSTGVQVGDMAARLASGEVVVLFPEGTTSDGNRVMPFKTSLFGAASQALALTPQGRVTIQPVTIAYIGIHGMPMGRFHRPVAAWPGTVALGPHFLRVLREGALEVEVHFCSPVVFDAASDRKQTARIVERAIRRTLAAALRGRQPEET